MNSKLERHTSLPGTLSVVRIVVAALLVLLAALPSSAQVFSSGSDGSDGALNLTLATPGVVGGVLTFNPADSTMFDNPTRVLDTDGDHIFHFTTITIGAGLTVKLTSQYFGGAVYWLATGAVAINGIIDLNGANGHSCTNTLPDFSLRRPAQAGAGGWNGGIGGWGGGPSSPLSAQPGSGPGGGTPAPTVHANGVPGTFTANLFLIPLIGGSGGSGGFNTAFSCFGGGGGAGGGAILIASSVSITVTSPGAIRANGGSAGFITGIGVFGGGGSGGGIRLMAPLISGNGSITASTTGTLPGTPGRLRLEAYQQSFTGSVSPPALLVSPTFLAPVLPSGPPPSIRVVSILVPPSTVVPLPANPGGSFTIPDATITLATPVTVNIEAENIPLGTVLKLYVVSESGPDIPPIDSTPLAGADASSSTATATVTFPSAFSRGWVRGTW